MFAIVIFKKLGRHVLKLAGLLDLADLVFSTRCALGRRGWLRSRKERMPVSFDGSPIPWLTYSAIDFLAGRIKPDFRILEFGSGNSSIWFGERCDELVSVEHDPVFARQLTPKLKPNSTLLLRPLPDPLARYQDVTFGKWDESNSYVSSVDEVEGFFDVVIVDGVFRNAVIRKLNRVLADDSVIVVDNTDYPEIETSLNYLAGQGWKRIDFTGMVPLVNYLNQTSVFYRAKNCFAI